MQKYRYSKGQALVLVLLSLSVVLTLVLYVVSRSITDIDISSKESSSVSAFSAAEAGVEKSLITLSAETGGSTFDNGNSNYNSSVDTGVGASTDYIYPDTTMVSGDTANFWLKSQTGSTYFNGNINICWGKTGEVATANSAAIELSFIYLATANDYSTAKVYRAAYDPYATRRSSNGFTATQAGILISGQSFPFCTGNISLAGMPYPQFLVVKVLYNPSTNMTPLGFKGSANFPSQGALITSVGTSGDATRRVQVFQGWKEYPSIFMSAIYSPSEISK